MPREDWRNREDERRAEPPERDDFGQADYSSDYGYDPRRRTGYRADEDMNVRGDDYGQADYSKDYGYDPAGRQAYRRYSEEDREYARRMDQGEYRREGAPRSWMARAGDFLSGSPRTDAAPRRRGPSDRVLWAVIVERLEDERRLDLRDVDVIVEDGEVTLNGTVRRKEDKRRIEDVADIDGVRHVQNNLRVRDRDHWTFL
jgi:hypothetical protein